MPTYFFKTTGGPTAHDAEGFDLPDLTAARRMAVRTACAMIAQAVEDFCATGEWQMTVADERGLVLFSLTFFASDAPAATPIQIGLDQPRPNSF